jgi:hypothetical protein
VAPPRRSLDRAARAGSLPETTTAARDAPAAASKAYSQPHQVEQDPHYAVHPGQQLGAGGATRLVEGPLEGVGPGNGPGLFLLGLPERLLGHLQPAGGTTVGRLGLGHDGLQAVAGLLGFGQTLTELVVVALEDRRSALGGGQPCDQLVQ